MLILGGEKELMQIQRVSFLEMKKLCGCERVE